MEFLARIFGSELFVSVVLVAVPYLLGRAFAWFKNELARRGEKARARAVEALEIGVDEAWERFGRAWKAARGGKLDDDERRRLRAFAREVADRAGRERGVDVVKEVGSAAIDVLIRKIIQRRKHGL